MSKNVRVEILNVDGDGPAREARTRVLREAGYEVVEASFGAAALDLVDTREPSLVLLQLPLPDMAGTLLCKSIKQRRPSTIVLQISADDRTGAEGGADAFLMQPLGRQALIGAIRPLLRLHAAEEALRSLDDLRHANLKLVEQIAERDRGEAALVQAQKLDAVGQLTGVMAHDFNNALAAVQGYLHLIRRRSGPGELHDLADKALGAVRRGARLTSRVLSFGHGRALRHEAVDTAALLAGMRDWLLQSTGKSVELSIDARGSDLIALTDANQLELAVLNLVINSCDAMPLGGRIEIVADRRHLTDPLDHLTGGEYVAISVKDNGPGMRAEVARRVFEPFYTTKPAGRGTGLGLAQVDQVARQSGGGARLSTGEGTGTTVELWLRAGGSEMLAPPPERMRPKPATSTRLLLVDDDLDVRVTVAAFLSGHGFLVDTASDGREAVDRLHASRPDAAILDVAMPGMSGIELARLARQIHPALPILFVSGNADPGAIEGQVAGAALLRKPFDPPTLLTALAAALAVPVLSPN
jgi:signal transduction histidine kinase